MRYSENFQGLFSCQTQERCESETWIKYLTCLNAFLGVCEQGSILMVDILLRPKNKKRKIRIFP